jgi:DNA replication protein
MTKFAGIPVKSDFTPVPNIFFSSLLPEILDLAELKVTLFVFEILYPKKGYPQFVTFNELLGNISLYRSLGQIGEPAKILQNALTAAVERGTLLSVKMESHGQNEEIYLLNSSRAREAAEKIRNGQLPLTGLSPRVSDAVPGVPPPNIFALYEENVGMLTPLIADELREAEKLYPEDWVREAIKEAVNSNKRNWRYISRILERWSTEGKNDGTHRKNIKENTDPDKYIKGKYGHLVRRK